MLTHKSCYHSYYNRRKFTVEKVRLFDQFEQALGSGVYVDMLSIPSGRYKTQQRFDKRGG